MKAAAKFLAAFLVSLILLLVIVPMFTGLQLNVMIALFFAAISGIIGFFVMLNHHNIVKGKHAPFLIGLLLSISSGGLLYGAVSFPMKPELYWQMPSQLITLLVILLIAGFATMILSVRGMFRRN